MIHELKIQKQWADAKLAGEKPFEIRRNDRGFQKGDTVRYRVVDPKTGEPWRGKAELLGQSDGRIVVNALGLVHPLENCDFLITYVREGADGLEKGYCVYADQPVPAAGARPKAGIAEEAFPKLLSRVDRLEQIVLPAKELAERHGITDAADPARHRTGICECSDMGKARTCPYRVIKFTGDECFNPGGCEWKRPVSADLGSGATPSNGTAEPLAPPSPLADTPGKDVHTVDSVSKPGAECKEYAARDDGTCLHRYKDGNAVFAECKCAKSFHFGKACVMGNCP